MTKNTTYNIQLNSMFKNHDGLTGVEVGVFLGENVSYILKSAEIKKLYLVDAWSKEVYLKWSNKIESPGGEERLIEGYNRVVSKFGCLTNIKIIKMESIDAAKLFDNDFFNFIYIDAAHSYNAVKNDIDSWYSKMKKGGLFGGHDYQWPGVRKAVDEFVLTNNMTLFNSRDVAGHCWWVLT